MPKGIPKHSIFSFTWVYVQTLIYFFRPAHSWICHSEERSGINQLSDLHVLFGCPEDSVVTSLRVCSPPQEGSGCGEGFSTYLAHQKQKPVACNKKNAASPVSEEDQVLSAEMTTHVIVFIFFSCHISCQTFRTNYQWLLWIIYYHDSWNWYCIQIYVWLYM